MLLAVVDVAQVKDPRPLRNQTERFLAALYLRRDKVRHPVFQVPALDHFSSEALDDVPYLLHLGKTERRVTTSTSTKTH